MKLIKEKERMCRELGNKEGLARSLVNQALFLASGFNKPREALPLAEEAYQLASTHGMYALVGQVKPFLDQVRAMLR